MIKKTVLLLLVSLSPLPSIAYSLDSSSPIVNNTESGAKIAESDKKYLSIQLPVIVNNYSIQPKTPEKQIPTNHESNWSASIIGYIKFIVYLYGICSVLIMLIIYCCRNLGAKKLIDKIRISQLNSSKIKFIYDALLNSRQDIILINGKWGSGKSTFIKNNLLNDKLSQSIPFVYLNCSEFENYRELLEQLIINSMTTTWLKKLFKFNLIHLLAKLSPITLKEFIFAGRVFILDDVERLTKLKNIEVEMIISLICYLQEQKKSKIILVANEDELISNQAFASLREKIICDTFSISKSFDSIYGEIVRDLVTEETDQTIFKNEDVRSGIKFFYDHTSNIRIIKHQIHNVLRVAQWWNDRKYDESYLDLYLKFIFGEDGFYTELFYLYTKNPFYLDLLAKLGVVYAKRHDFISQNLISIYKPNSVHDLITKFNLPQKESDERKISPYTQQQIDELLKQILAIDDFGLIKSSLITDKLSNDDWSMIFNKKQTDKIENTHDISQMSVQVIKIIKQQFEAIDKGDLSSFVEHYSILEDDLNFTMIDENLSIDNLNQKLQTYINFALRQKEISIPQKTPLHYALINALTLDYIINSTDESSTALLERLWTSLKKRTNDTQDYENLKVWLKNNIQKENGKYFKNLLNLFEFIFNKLTATEISNYFNFCYETFNRIKEILTSEQSESVNSLLIEHMDYEHPTKLHAQYLDLIDFNTMGITSSTLKKEDAEKIANKITDLTNWRNIYDDSFINDNLSQLKSILYPENP